MTWYNVEIIVENVVTGATHQEIVKFKSSWAAKFMAKQYAACADVIRVDCIDQLTGEVLYYCDRDGREYEAE